MCSHFKPYQKLAMFFSRFKGQKQACWPPGLKNHQNIKKKKKKQVCCKTTIVKCTKKLSYFD
jgi:hypothetical protein